MKKHISVILCLFFCLLLVSCNMLENSLKDYLDEYTNNAFLDSYVIPGSFPRDATGSACVGSYGHVQLYLINPKNFDLGFTYTFNDSVTQELYNTNFASTEPIQFIRTGSKNNAYEIVFPELFLSNLDNCVYGDPADGYTKDLSGYISTYETTTMRPFGSMEIKVRADTKPTYSGYAALQFSENVWESPDVTAKYIVCFCIPHTSLNKDITTIRINNDTWTVTYGTSDISITASDSNEGELRVNPEGSSIPTLYPVIEGGDIFSTSSPECADADIFYYLSEKERTANETVYNIKISDWSGLSAAASISNKADQLAPVNFSFNPEEEEILVADNTGSIPLTISPVQRTTQGKSVSASISIEYQIEKVSISSGDIDTYTEDQIVTGPVHESMDTNPGWRYVVKARAKANGYLSSDWTTMNSFEVLHNPHFFVSSSGSADGNGSTTSPFSTFKDCLRNLREYDELLNASYTSFIPSDGYYVEVLSDISAESNDFIETSGLQPFLISSKIPDSAGTVSNYSFTKPVTIRGVTESGSATMHTINANASSNNQRSILFWGYENELYLKDLTFTGAVVESSSRNGGAIQLYSYEACLKVFFNDCIITGNNAYTGAGIYFYDCPPLTSTTNSLVSLENCFITGNTASAGGGIQYSYIGNRDCNSTLKISNCTISGNNATAAANGGGGIRAVTTGATTSYFGTVHLTGSTEIISNTTGAGGGGLSIGSHLTIDSPSVEITNNRSGTTGLGGGIEFTNSNSTFKLSGAIIKDNTDGSFNVSNLYLPTGKQIEVTGNLSGSMIGVTALDEPVEAGEPAVTFATYENPISSGVFFSDNGLSINQTSTSASLYFSGASGGVTIPAAFFGDYILSVTRNGNACELTASLSLDNEFIISITHANGDAIGYESIPDFTVSSFGESIPASETTWSYSMTQAGYLFTIFTRCLEGPGQLTISFVGDDGLGYSVTLGISIE